MESVHESQPAQDVPGKDGRVDTHATASRHFVADPGSWDRFMEVLERPPAPAAALVRLLRDRKS
jgi:hypothetical protein